MTIEYHVSRAARDVRPGDCLVQAAEFLVLAPPVDLGDGMLRIPVRPRWKDAETPPATVLVVESASVTVQELA